MPTIRTNLKMELLVLLGGQLCPIVTVVDDEVVGSGSSRSAAGRIEGQYLRVDGPTWGGQRRPYSGPVLTRKKKHSITERERPKLTLTVWITL